jgi:hypothetical protein
MINAGDDWKAQPQTKREYRAEIKSGKTTATFEQWAIEQWTWFTMYSHHNIPYWEKHAGFKRAQECQAREHEEQSREWKRAQEEAAAAERKRKKEQEDLIKHGEKFKGRGKSDDALSRTLLEILKMAPASSNREVFCQLAAYADSQHRVIQAVNFEMEVVQWKGRVEKETAFESIIKHRLPALRKKL